MITCSPCRRPRRPTDEEHLSVIPFPGREMRENGRDRFARRKAERSGRRGAAAGGSVAEAAEAALVEEERIALAGRAHGHDAAHDDEVVPARVHGLDPAVDPGGHGVELR